MVAICSSLFLIGVLFGYYIISPFAINFLTGYDVPGVQNTPTISSFINYMIMFTAPAGLIFELPIIVYFLSKVGLVTPEGMKQYRRHSIVGILILTRHDHSSGCGDPVPDRYSALRIVRGQYSGFGEGKQRE